MWLVELGEPWMVYQDPGALKRLGGANLDLSPQVSTRARDDKSTLGVGHNDVRYYPGRSLAFIWSLGPPRFSPVSIFTLTFVLVLSLTRSTTEMADDKDLAQHKGYLVPEAAHEAAGQGHAATDLHGRSLVEFDRAAERRLRWKIDLYTVPTVSLLYLFCFIDRANIGMIGDPHAGLLIMGKANLG